MWNIVPYARNYGGAARSALRWIRWARAQAHPAQGSQDRVAQAERTAPAFGEGGLGREARVQRRAQAMAAG